MKLANILSAVNQVEKSKFINFLDRICSEATIHDKELAKRINSLDGQIKNASSGEIIKLFELVLPYFEKNVKDQLAMLGAQAALLVNILSRDGNCIARLSWIEALYTKEWSTIDTKSKEVKSLISESYLSEELNESKRLEIYFSCLKEAYTNDERNNREARITDDERSILNVLSKKLDITQDNKSAVEHLVNSIPQAGVQECLNTLREVGLVFISRKNLTVYIADEIVAMLNRMQGKELADKHLLRILRTLSDSELSNILKSHGKRIRGKERIEKINEIIKMGLLTSQILKQDISNPEANINDRKERLKNLISDLDLSLDKIGTTLGNVRLSQI
ncbi:hypothetical protein EBI00_15815, partial [Marinomonas hwangdonensis]